MSLAVSRRFTRKNYSVINERQGSVAVPVIIADKTRGCANREKSGERRPRRFANKVAIGRHGGKVK